jgi:hypothetical protein
MVRRKTAGLASASTDNEPLEHQPGTLEGSTHAPNTQTTDNAQQVPRTRGGRRSRDKGNRAEREVVAILQEAGIAGERVPLSGGAGGSFVGDVCLPVLGRNVRLEVKCRATGFATIYRWLAANYGLVLRADHSQPLIVLRLRDFAEIAIRADYDRVRR